MKLIRHDDIFINFNMIGIEADLGVSPIIYFPIQGIILDVIYCSFDFIFSQDSVYK